MVRGLTASAPRNAALQPLMDRRGENPAPGIVRHAPTGSRSQVDHQELWNHLQERHVNTTGIRPGTRSGPAGSRFDLAAVGESPQTSYQSRLRIHPSGTNPSVHCPHCNRSQSDHSKFCSDCGGSLSGKFHSMPTIREPGPPAADPDSAPPQDGPLDAGQKIAGRYRIVSPLGRGGMGEVYRADDLQLGESAALKFLPPRVAADPVSLDHVRREVRIARGVTHPNVCRIHDIGEADGQLFISMEWVDGEDLGAALKRMGRPSREKALELARQLCLALAAVHDAGIIHRDVKPSNIMIDGRGNVRLMDFGIASAQQEPAGDPKVAGTPLYMAPELFEGNKASVRSDIYALGLVLYEIFTGKRAYGTEDLPSLRDPTGTTTPTAPSAHAAEIDPLVERAIILCLGKDPANRPASAYAVLNLLPGDDPLAATVAAGQTPSPEMVAAAGNEGLLGARSAKACVTWIAAGLLFLVWLSQFSVRINQGPQPQHPGYLAGKARDTLGAWGYDTAARQFTGFLSKGDELRFWYRQRSGRWGLYAQNFFSGWGQLSRGRVTPDNPSDTAPGECNLEFDLTGTLARFQADPPLESAGMERSAPPDWQDLFPKELVGFDLGELEPDTEALPPPVPYDHLQSWRGSGNGEGFRVEAATYRGKPVFFARTSESTYEDLQQWGVETYRPEIEQGRHLMLVVFWTLLVGSWILAWRNYRLGRVDRRGSWRVAFFLFVCGMMSWLLLATHHTSVYEILPLEIGMANALRDSARFWIFYLALEPYVRKWWPRCLIASNRLLDGGWRDPLVGRDLLVGVSLGLFFSILHHLAHAAPDWLRWSPRTLLDTDPLLLEGPASTLGWFLSQLPFAMINVAVLLFSFLLARVVLRGTILAGVVVTIAWAIVFTWFFGLDPVLGPIIMGLHTATFLWVVARFGYLAAVVWNCTRHFLEAPITLDFSRWYAGNGIIAFIALAVLAGWGYYHSQRGRRPPGPVLRPQDTGV